MGEVFMLMKKASRAVTLIAMVILIPVAVFAGLSGHPWEAAGLTATVLGIGARPFFERK